MTQDLFKIFPPVIAHRGLSGRAPENTLVAFTKAAQTGVKWIEFDVMLAACHTPIIFHDESLLRTTGMKGLVADYSYAHLRTLDAGAWFDLKFAGEKIPSLECVLEWLKNNKMNANIEIKPNPGQEVLTVEQALPLINQYFPQPTSRILFSSFAIDSLRAVRRALPDAHLGYLMHVWNPGWQKICDELSCTTVNINAEILTPERASAIKATGRQIFCYTVNSVATADELYAMGVDAVFSDFPDNILTHIDKCAPIKAS